MIHLNHELLLHQRTLKQIMKLFTFCAQCSIQDSVRSSLLVARRRDRTRRRYFFAKRRL